jgi:hypothetical protein
VGFWCWSVSGGAGQAGAKPGHSEWSSRHWTSREATGARALVTLLTLMILRSRSCRSLHGRRVYRRGCGDLRSESFAVARVQVRCDVVVLVMR